MKRLFIILLLLPALYMVACKKAKGPASPPSVQPNDSFSASISAVVNGIPWQTDSAFAYRVVSSGNDTSKSNLFISAIQKSNSATISFSITNYAGPATYNISPPYNTATYYAHTSRHYASTGQLVITSDTGATITGTFHFMTDSFNVTNGDFTLAHP